MCVAIAGLSAATVAGMFSAASTALSIGGSYLSSKQQASAQEEMWKYENEKREQDYAQQTSQLTYQQGEANQQALVEKTERARQAAIERARLRVATGEAGIGGLTPARLEGQTNFEEGFDLQTIESNRESKVRQAEYQKTTLQQSPGSVYIDSGASLGWALAEGALSIPTSYATTKKVLEK